MEIPFATYMLYFLCVYLSWWNTGSACGFYKLPHHVVFSIFLNSNNIPSSCFLSTFVPSFSECPGTGVVYSSHLPVLNYFLSSSNPWFYFFITHCKSMFLITITLFFPCFSCVVWKAFVAFVRQSFAWIANFGAKINVLIGLPTNFLNFLPILCL